MGCIWIILNAISLENGTYLNSTGSDSNALKTVEKPTSEKVHLNLTPEPEPRVQIYRKNLYFPDFVPVANVIRNLVKP